MLAISLGDMTGFFAAIDDMTKQINAIPGKMAQELTDWQTEDVHFKIPVTDVIDPYTVETIVWPRGKRKRSGRFTGRGGGRRKFVRRVRVRKRDPNKPTRKYVRHKPLKPRRSKLITGKKPLLRPFLYDELVAREFALLGTIEWR